jgi:hypothetical protein
MMDSIGTDLQTELMAKSMYDAASRVKKAIEKKFEPVLRGDAKKMLALMIKAKSNAPCLLFVVVVIIAGLAFLAESHIFAIIFATVGTFTVLCWNEVRQKAAGREILRIIDENNTRYWIGIYEKAQEIIEEDDNLQGSFFGEMVMSLVE